MPAPSTSTAKKRVRDEESRRDKMWMKLFKTSEPKTDHDSLLYQSRIAYICITQYLLFRHLLPLGVFEKRRVSDNVVIHTFKNQHADGSPNRWGTKLSEMMRGMTEAIQHKYARQAIVMINENEDEPNSATEVFTICFVYSQQDCVRIIDQEGNEVVNLSYKGKESFRQQVGYILEKIALAVDKLPKLDKSKAKPYMKMTYYEERTPSNFQPTAFKACNGTYYFKGKPPQLQMGTINTEYGALAFDLQSDYIRDIDQLEEEIQQAQMETDVHAEPTISVEGSLFREDVEVRRSSPPVLQHDEENVHEMRWLHGTDDGYVRSRAVRQISFGVTHTCARALVKSPDDKFEDYGGSVE